VNGGGTLAALVIAVLLVVALYRPQLERMTCPAPVWTTGHVLLACDGRVPLASPAPTSGGVRP
jgi:hypothetical protein